MKNKKTKTGSGKKASTSKINKEKNDKNKKDKHKNKKEKIYSEPLVEKKESKNIVKSDWFIIIAVFAIFLIVAASLFGIRYISSPRIDQQTIEYNGFTFVNVSGIWMTNMVYDGRYYELMFKYPPTEVEDIPIIYDINWFTKLTSERRHIYITFNPEDDNLGYIALGATDLTRSLTRVYGLHPIAACTKNVTEACSNVPIITCQNTFMPVIYLKDDPEAKIKYRNNCLIIQGEKEELSKAVEKTILNWYKIIPDEI